ncbi:MAG: flagellar hook-basal body complex protein FliE [Gammaproteobacteria bacterium]|nr:flagellar hook-basal body complex protein FliE [Gammaproteobacteria bacterium]MDH5800648.1 flagellar hook-basal body complex protein FliE [Gammaproteobacteria bacterium]
MALEINEVSAISNELSLSPSTQNSGADFARWVESQIGTVDQQIKVADTKLEALAAGENNNLHDVMLTLEKAKLSFQLALEVRNKLLESYQEIMRMQV